MLFHHIPPDPCHHIFHRSHPNLYTQRKQPTKIHIDLQDKISLLLDLSSVVKIEIQKDRLEVTIVVVSNIFWNLPPRFFLGGKCVSSNLTIIYAASFFFQNLGFLGEKKHKKPPSGCRLQLWRTFGWHLGAKLWRNFRPFGEQKTVGCSNPILPF